MITLHSNCAVFVFKVLAYLYSGSAAMLSEAVHSLADMLNQVHVNNYSIGVHESTT